VLTGFCFERKKASILEVPSWRREMPAGGSTSTQAGLVVPSSELFEKIRRGERERE
jgi:hypothetical protein